MQIRRQGLVRLLLCSIVAIAIAAGILTAKAQLKAISLNSPATLPADI